MNTETETEIPTIEPAEIENRLRELAKQHTNVKRTEDVLVEFALAISFEPDLETRMTMAVSYVALNKMVGTELQKLRKGLFDQWLEPGASDALLLLRFCWVEAREDKAVLPALHVGRRFLAHAKHPEYDVWKFLQKDELLKPLEQLLEGLQYASSSTP